MTEPSQSLEIVALEHGWRDDLRLLARSRTFVVGAVIVLPAITGYTIYAYRVFWGKARELTYY